MGVKCNIFYALYEGQTQHILRFLWGTDATVYILRSIWGTDAIYFTLDMMDKHNIFYALFDVYSVFKTSGEYYYCNDKIQDNTRKTYVCFNVLISILATFFLSL